MVAADILRSKYKKKMFISIWT